MGVAELNVVSQVRGPAMSGRAGDGPGVSRDDATDANTAGNLAELVGQVLPIWEMHIETSRALAEDSIEGLAPVSRASSTVSSEPCAPPRKPPAV